MIIVFVERVTPRIEYIFDLLLNSILKLQFSITVDKVAYINYDGPKFHYGRSLDLPGIYFGGSNLLFENSISEQSLNPFKEGLESFFYPVSEGMFSFDPFACSFYLVSRYEEYRPHIKDRYGRYFSEESLAFKSGFLDRPMINIWAQKIKKTLSVEFPELQFPELSYSFLPTIDIDNAYAFKNKGILRTILSCFSLLLHFDFGKLKDRAKVHLGLLKDPYDTYEKQHKIHQLYQVKPLYFILIGNYGKFDKNLSHKHPKFISLIKELASSAEICLHPSYASQSDEEQLIVEKKRLEKIIGRTVVKSRNHFIRINLPKSYRKLEEAGIKEDYSMGYPDKVGYRASIATPFYFYDLEREKSTNLKIFPFVVMDITLKKYLHIRSKDVIDYLTPIIKESRSIGGNFIFIFHNESMGGEKMWRNWSDLYEKIIKLSMN